MGLCKCPKRKVTNQFCFEHRVNVCEHCLVSTHPKCIVKSYLHWLQDSDYTPVCLICNEDLSQGDCIRLQCYDVFHWNCLSQIASKLPPSSIKTELVCPTCKTTVLPPEKLVSPVADAVRQKLAEAGWGRKMLGLPAEERKVDTKQQSVRTPTGPPSRPMQEKVNIPSDKPNHAAKQVAKQAPRTAPTSVNNTAQSMSNNTSMNYNYGRDNFYSDNQTQRKVYDTRQDERLNIPFDHDENKYKRKSLFDRIGALLRLQRGPSKHSADEPKLTFKRVFIFLVLLVIGFMTVILILSRVGRGFANTDPLLDPKANPNIHVQDTNLVT